MSTHTIYTTMHVYVPLIHAFFILRTLLPDSKDTVLESYSRMLSRANEKTLGKLVGITQ